MREIPAGSVSLRSAWFWTLLSAALFVGCSAMLGLHTLALSPVAIAVIWGYSLTKRYTFLCHAFLGVALALAPMAVWIALTQEVGWVAVILSVAVGTWVAGFDIIYSCQDVAFDRDNSLYSVPAVFGVPKALVISGALHVLTVASLAALPWCVSLAWPYWVGFCAITAVLVWEHSIVKPNDLSRINRAFFDLNGYISLVFLIGLWFS